VRTRVAAARRADYHAVGWPTPPAPSICDAAGLHMRALRRRGGLGRVQSGSRHVGRGL